MTPKPNDKPERVDPWLELDPPEQERSEPQEEQPETVRVEPAALEPAAQTADTVAPSRSPLSLRDSWRTLVLVAMGFAALIGTFLYFQLQPDPEAKYKRGLAAFDNKDWDTAITYFTEVIRLRPGDGAGYSARGQALIGKKQYDQALIDCAEAIRLNSRDAYAYVGRAICHWQLGDTDRALSDCGTAIRLDPKYSEALGVRGSVYMVRGEYDQALVDLNQAIQLKPGAKENYMDRASVYYQLKNYDRAFADYDRVLNLDAKDGGARVGRGMIHAIRKHYPRAIADFEAGIRLDPSPEQGSGYNHLAWLLATCPEAKFRDGKRAVELATKACELTSWNDGGCLGSLAAAHAEAGDFAEAVKWQKKSLEHPEPNRDELEKAKERLKLYEQGKAYREE